MKKLFLFVTLFALISLNTFGQSKKMQQSIDSCKMVIEQQALKINELDTKLNNLYAILGTLRNSLNDLPKGLLLVPSNSINNSQEPSNVKETDAPKVAGQCKALTQAGSQCKRSATTGTKFCWQHQTSRAGEIKEENSETSGNTENKVTTPETKSSSPANSYSGSRTIQTGSRGGQYYINSNGNKTYVKRK